MNIFNITKERKIGQDQPVFIIAEIGINHNGDIKLAKEMVRAAKECGVDAVKFQTFKANEFIADPKETYTYYSQGEKVTESMLEMFQRYEFSKENWKEIADYCNELGIVFFTTPQNYSDLEAMLGIAELPLIKVGSDDLTNLPLLEKYAQKRLPMIISAGMAYLSEIEDAVETIRMAGNNNISVLHCIASYPAEAEEVNMLKMKTISEAFDTIPGFSDHTQGDEAVILATALGAKIIEKHFTLDKGLPGPDHWFAADVDELKSLVKAVRNTELMMGSRIIRPTEKELEMRKIARRSIVAAVDIGVGEVISEEKIEFKRPGTGLPPKFSKQVIGRTAKAEFKRGDKITFKEL